MISERLDVRLGPEHRRRLSEVARVRGISQSDLVRDMIDHAYEQILQAERLRAARELAELAIEDVPDPEELSRRLDGAYAALDLP